MSARASVFLILLVLTLHAVQFQEGFPAVMRFSRGIPAERGIVLAGETLGEIMFADHTDSLEEGNWVELAKGTSVRIPNITLQYGGPFSVAVARDGVRIDIRLAFMSKRITYPLDRHDVYLAGEEGVARFHGSTTFSGREVEARLVRTSPVEIIRVLEAIINRGKVGALKQLLSTPIWSTVVTLDKEGDATVRFRVNTPGFYVLVFLEEEQSPYYRLRLYSATPVLVLGRMLNLSLPTKLVIGQPITVKASIQGAPPAGTRYIYGAMILHEDSYKLHLRLVTTGRCQVTIVRLNGAVLTRCVVTREERAFKMFGIGLERVTPLFLANWIVKVFGANRLAISFHGPTERLNVTLRIPTSTSMPSGRYVLIAWVWEVGKGLVALRQESVTLVRPSQPP